MEAAISMKYLSVCSGIEAASVAWKPLGFEPVAFSEIDKFCNRVLAHHFPEVPNLGDMTQYETWDFPDGFDILVGGTPCQSFSSAGKRSGLDDERGQLAITFCKIAERFRPTWVVWENVTGVLSSNGGRDFGTIVGALAKSGYGWAYRVFDAKYFGVPQQRRRVFLVGHLGNWVRAAQVLHDGYSLRRHPEKVQEAEDLPATHDRKGNGRTGGVRYAKSLMSKDNNQDASMDTFVFHNGLLRRLTPLEWERLQGFPDNWTSLPPPPRSMDTSRYRAIGNSTAVPVLRWIGQRLLESSKSDRTI